jgi:hypothetical protein
LFPFVRAAELLGDRLERTLPVPVRLRDALFDALFEL